MGNANDGWALETFCDSQLVAEAHDNPRRHRFAPGAMEPCPTTDDNVMPTPGHPMRPPRFTSARSGAQTNHTLPFDQDHSVGTSPFPRAAAAQERVSMNTNSPPERQRSSYMPPKEPHAFHRDIQYRIYSSVSELPRSELDGILPGEPESWDFYRVVESVPPPLFTLKIIAGFEGSRLLVVAPLFYVTYRVDTPLQGALRRAGNWIHSRSPYLTSLRVIGLGSPMSDNLTIGFASHLALEDRQRAFEGLLACLKREADRDKSVLVAIKSMDQLTGEMHPILAARNYRRVTSVPLVMLDLPYRSMDDYLTNLPQKTASYLRRKNRSAKMVRVEYRRDIAGL
jgi:hypothetical protein